MATSYVPAGSKADIQVLSPTKVIDVVKASAYTFPSNVYFEFPIPLSLWNQNQGEDYLEAIASGIEDLIKQGMVVGGSYIEEQDNNDLLADYIDLRVSYQPAGTVQGPFEAIVRVALNSFVASVDPFFGRLAGAPQAKILAAYEKLEAMAAL